MLKGVVGVSQIFGLLKGGARKCLMKQVWVLEYFEIMDSFSSIYPQQVFVNAPLENQCCSYNRVLTMS